MEVKIRLQRAGKPASKRYNYRIVAISRAENRDSKHLDLLGYYDPAKKTANVSIDEDKLNKWLKNGARMSDTVKSLLKSQKKNK